MSGAAHVTARFRALDGWRGICALLVAAHHVEARGFLYWQPLIRDAWLFVDFFFVLSGFVIAHAYGEAFGTSAQLRSFAVRRLGRLWPLHVAVLGALIFLELVRWGVALTHPMPGEVPAFTGGRSPEAILANLFLVQSLGLFRFETWNGPAWSISTEFYTYLVFALAFFALRSTRERLLASALIAFLGVFVLARFSDYGMRETFGFGFFRCLYGFFMGVLTYAAWRNGWSRALSGSLAETIALIVVIAFVAVAPHDRTLEYFAPPLFALAVLVFAGERGWLSKVLVARPAAALGRWSYSIYMVHTLVIALVFSALHAGELAAHQTWLAPSKDGNAVIALGPANDAVLLAILCAVVALAAFTWRFVERPGQRLFARIGGHADTNTLKSRH
jgi:peptidoglycan/LPS O-acetylase OafA/YrhL